MVRGLVFDDVTLQRESVMRDIEAQIALVEQQVQGQVDEIFTRIETIKEETLVQSFEVSERLINLVYRRVFILLLVALAGGAEACLALGLWRAWEAMRVMAPDTCRPFSRGRRGIRGGRGDLSEGPRPRTTAASGPRPCRSAGPAARDGR